MEDIKTAIGDLTDTVTSRLQKQDRALDEMHARLQKFSANGAFESRRDLPWLDLKALTVGNDPAGGYLVPVEHSPNVIDRMRPSSVLLASGVQTINTTAQALTMSRITGDPTATWRGELETLSGTGEGSYGLVRAVPKKVAAYVVTSRELLEDSNPEIAMVLERQISTSLALALDAAAFDAPSVNASGAPTPLRAVPGITSTPIANNGSVPSDFAWFHSAFNSYLEANANPSTAVLFMAPRTWKSLMSIPVETGSNVPALFNQAPITGGPIRSIFGVPVFISNQIPTTETEGTSTGVCSSVYLADTTQIAVVFRQGARVELDRSRHFDQDAIGVRGTLRADLVVLNPAAVVHVPGFKV